MFKFLKGIAYVGTGFGFLGLWRPFKTPDLVLQVGNTHNVVLLKRYQSSRKYDGRDFDYLIRTLKKTCIKPHRAIESVALGTSHICNIWDKKHIKEYRKMYSGNILNQVVMTVTLDKDYYDDIGAVIRDINSELKSSEVHSRNGFSANSLEHSAINRLRSFGLESSMISLSDKLKLDDLECFYCEECGPPSLDAECKECGSSFFGDEEPHPKFKKYVRGCNKLIVDTYNLEVDNE